LRKAPYRQDRRRRAAIGAAAAGCGARHRRRLPPGNPVLARRSGGKRDRPLGIEHFGQSGDIPDLYRAHGIDTDAILDAAARACLTTLR
jgi:hypothetical protein